MPIPSAYFAISPKSPSSCSSSCSKGQAGHAAQLSQVSWIEGLNEHRAAVRGIAVALQSSKKRAVSSGKPIAGEMRRVLGFRIYPDLCAAAPPIRIGRQSHDFIEGRDGESPVELAVLRPQLG